LPALELSPAPESDGLRHPLHGHKIGTEPVVYLVLLGHLVDRVEGRGHLLVELLVDLLRRPVVHHGVLHLLEIGNGDPAGVAEEIGDHVNALVEEDRVGFGMLEDLSRYSKMRLDPSQFEPVDLNKLLSDVREDLGSILSGVELRLPQDLPTVFGRPSLLSELFANLIHNAVKFNDKDKPVVEVGWKPYRAETYLFWVRDNGPGIPAEYLDKIFQLFEQLDRSKEGTGAGLAICRRIVEEHGGRIWAESQVGQGATFYFTLPKVPVRKGVESNAH